MGTLSGAAVIATARGEPGLLGPSELGKASSDWTLRVGASAVFGKTESLIKRHSSNVSIVPPSMGPRNIHREIHTKREWSHGRRYWEGSWDSLIEKAQDQHSKQG